jgi:hypothetical protein
MLDAPAAVGASNHVAGWIGVGGPGLGPHGADEWLQVGLATFGDSNEGRLYYELARPGHAPEYVELATGIVPGIKVRVAVLELQFARDAWIVVSPAGIAARSTSRAAIAPGRRSRQPRATRSRRGATATRTASAASSWQAVTAAGARCAGPRRCRMQAGSSAATAPPRSAPPAPERGYTSRRRNGTLRGRLMVGRSALDRVV